MVAIAFFGPVETGRRVAVDTTEPTGIVHADIPTRRTAAGCTLGWIFSGGDVKSENISDQAVINAFSWKDDLGTVPLFFGTAADLHAVCRAGISNVVHEAVYFFLRRLNNLDAFFFQHAKPPGGLSINIHKADDALPGITV